MDRQRWLGLGLVALVALALAGYLAASHQSFVQALRSYLTPAAIVGRPAGGGTSAPVTAGAAAHGAAAAVDALIAWHGHLLLWGLAALLGVLLAGWVGQVLLRTRWSRELSTVEVVLGPDDRAEPEEVTRLIDNLWGILQQVYAGSLTGARWWCFEIVKPGTTAASGLHLLLTAPADAMAAIEGAWHSKYTNVRFVPWPGPDQPLAADPAGEPAHGTWTTAAALVGLSAGLLAWAAGASALLWALLLHGGAGPAVLGLLWLGIYAGLLRGRAVGRGRPWPHYAWGWAMKLSGQWFLPLSAAEQQGANLPVETMLSNIEREPGPVRVQWVCTPAAFATHGRLKGAVSARQAEASAGSVGAAGIGMGLAAGQELQSALEGVGRSWWRVELRVAAGDWGMLRAVRGGLAEVGAQNHLLPTTIVRGWNPLSEWWHRCLERRLPARWPFSAMLLSSQQLAALIQLPSARLRIQGLSRSLVRRGVPPHGEANRDPEDALVEDEAAGPIPDRPATVGLHWEDTIYNLLVPGAPGMGKSTFLQAVFRVFSRHQEAAVVVLDPNHDLAEACLSLLPEGREVIHFAPGEEACPVGYNPLLQGSDPDQTVAGLLHSMTYIWSPQLFGPRSRDFTEQAARAALELASARGRRATLEDVLVLLRSPQVAEELRGLDPASPARRYWLGEFAALWRDDRRFVREALAAPINKLHALLTPAALRRTLCERPSLDLAELVRGRRVLIADISKERLGVEPAHLIGTLLLAGLWQAIHAQERLPVAERVPVLLVVDEGYAFLGEEFRELLVEGRKYGARVAVALHFLGQAGELEPMLVENCRNRVVFATPNQRDAEFLAREMARVYYTLLQPTQEAQDILNFGPDDFLHLGRHQCICFWQVHGRPQPPFLGHTIPSAATEEGAAAAQARAVSAWGEPKQRPALGLAGVEDRLAAQPAPPRDGPPRQSGGGRGPRHTAAGSTARVKSPPSGPSPASAPSTAGHAEAHTQAAGDDEPFLPPELVGKARELRARAGVRDAESERAAREHPAGASPLTWEQAQRVGKALGAPPERVAAAFARLQQRSAQGRVRNPVAYFRAILGQLAREDGAVAEAAREPAQAQAAAMPPARTELAEGYLPWAEAVVIAERGGYGPSVAEQAYRSLAEGLGRGQVVHPASYFRAMLRGGGKPRRRGDRG